MKNKIIAQFILMVGAMLVFVCGFVIEAGYIEQAVLLAALIGFTTGMMYYHYWIKN